MSVFFKGVIPGRSNRLGQDLHVGESGQQELDLSYKKEEHKAEWVVRS